MERCDVLIVGGGPAGSSCAWMLRRAGVDVALLDRNEFPRDKICGGWITPAAAQELELDTQEYGKGRIFQPITGFRTCRMGDPVGETHYNHPVSFGIRRFEFDDYLLRRSGARLYLGQPLKKAERDGSEWVVNDRIRARLLVGAGGHYCPVARMLGARIGSEPVVAAQEAELPMDPAQADACAVRPEVPELFFCRDMRGYGWCFRKKNYLNVGLGRLGSHRLPSHVGSFIDLLKSTRRIPQNYPSSLNGHAYLVYGSATRSPADDGVLLIGDAAGLAYPESGEGIRPAIESGLIAAETIIEAREDYRRDSLEAYPAKLTARFGETREHWTRQISRMVPDGLANALAGRLLTSAWFSRHILLDRWFLHSQVPAL